MAKIRTLQQLQDALDAEFSWRLFELTHLTRVLRSSAGGRQESLIRASVAMLYAHWEGFIKESASLYLDFVNRKGLRSDQAANSFAYLSMKRKISEMAGTNNIALGLAAYNELRESVETGVTLSFSTNVDTGSNLNSRIFASIAASVGVASDRYEPYYNLIDEGLLKQRNTIAHGQFVGIEQPAYQELHDIVLMLIRWFKDDIENAASTRAYLSV